MIFLPTRLNADTAKSIILGGIIIRAIVSGFITIIRLTQPQLTQIVQAQQSNACLNACLQVQFYIPSNLHRVNKKLKYQLVSNNLYIKF